MLPGRLNWIEAIVGLWDSPGPLPASTPNTHITHTVSQQWEHFSIDTLVPTDVPRSASCPQRLSEPDRDLFTMLDLPAWEGVCNSNLLRCHCSFLTYLLSTYTKNTQFSRGFGNCLSCPCQSLVLVTFSGTREGRKAEERRDLISGQLLSFVPLLLLPVG